MTTEYRDETGKLLRVDKGTQPAKAAQKPAPAAAPRAPAAAPAPAKKEK